MSKKFRITLLAIVATFSLAAVSCGDSEEEAGEDTTQSNDSSDESLEQTDNTSQEQPSEEETTEETTEENNEVVEVNLVEWAIEGPQEIKAGTVTIKVNNTGEFPHKLGVTKGDSYETLPQKANGAVDEEALGLDFLGDTGNIEPGESFEIQYDLEPGNYVFMCNIEAGPNAHAAKGQVLSVTVVE